MTTSAQQKPSILIIGAGTFGLATAHELATAGYKSVTVLEKDDQVPSRFSAGYDLNKIVRAEYADPFYTDLSVAAIHKWRSDPLYQPFYHERGYLNVTSGSAPQATKDGLARYLSSIERHPAFRGKITRVDGGDDVKRLVPQFGGGPVAGWSGYLNEMAGYAHSMDAMEAVHRECVKLGVKFHLGPQHGEVASLVYAEDGTERLCAGALTRDGQTHRADKTIVSAGAGVVTLMPQTVGQKLGIAARCWGVAHLQLSPDEAAHLRGIPVTNVRDLAFFFEPDLTTGKLKFCHMGGGFSNYYDTKDDGLSRPRADLADSRLIPAVDVEHIRRLLREALPHLADRPLIDAHLCWIADSGTSDFVIDYVPGCASSLVVTTGDSGHGFKMMPIFGGFVRNILESGRQGVDKWGWREGGAEANKGMKNWRTGGAGRDLATVTMAKL